VPDQTVPIAALYWHNGTSSLSFHVTAWVILAVLFIAILAVITRLWIGSSLRTFEIDQAEIGIGQNKFKFKPNATDRQVAYTIWVELSTRKIGLPIDFENDVITEVYDSWYAFFGVTRELIKTIPSGQVKNTSTQNIILISVEILNEALRPHLTHWQARFRHWYDRELKRYEQESGFQELDPQAIQARFPKYTELCEDMRRVNSNLVQYRKRMHDLATGK